ncbi:zinc finger protein 37-like isoform X3 [Nerophis ophidion]|uniref:zinc finger protein 37-like isoform X3 n=1 Tax=Nerophis ophidion TaxID=159077 RepID=UPI002AE0A313|nr:zinc finger protein 37-like isoform X3 [Nerophis ophidion]
MCKVQMLRLLVNQRLNEAVEEIFVVLERTVAEYERELSRTKEENERLHQLLDAVFRKLPRTDCFEGNLPEQQEWSSRMEQEEAQPAHTKEDEDYPQLQEDIEEPQLIHIKEEDEEPLPQQIKEEDEEPQHPHIKKEEDEVPDSPVSNRKSHSPSTLKIKRMSHKLPQNEEEEEHSMSQDGEHLEGLEEVDVTKMPLIVFIVKSEDDEGEGEEKGEVEPPTPHMTTEADGDHCGGSQADKVFAPLSDNEDLTSHSPDTDDEDSKSDMTCHTDNKHLKCSYCDKTFNHRGHLKTHTRTHTGEKPFMCSVCSKSFSRKTALKKIFLSSRSGLPGWSRKWHSQHKLRGMRSTHNLKRSLRSHSSFTLKKKMRSHCPSILRRKGRSHSTLTLKRRKMRCQIPLCQTEKVTAHLP